MSFERKNFVRIGSSQTNGVPTVWQYISGDDVFTDILVDTYFLEIVDILQPGDAIFITDAFGVSDFYAVQAVSPGAFVLLRSVNLTEFTGTFTTPGGSTTVNIPVIGVNSAQLSFVQVKTQGVAGVFVEASSAGSDLITVEFNVDPGPATVVKYQVMRDAD